ncbi:MAG TPA: hypothetical protein VGI38_02095 [Puia sp.]|jgi:hypothetical protein
MKPGSTAVFCIIFLFVVHPAKAQTAQEDSIFYQTAITNTLSIYKKQLGDQSPIYNGSRYSPTGFIFQSGSPYFISDTFNEGSVVYDDILFDSVYLLYEDMRELLVSRNTNYLLQLVNQRVSSFIISGHSFVRLTSDSFKTDVPKAGYYEILYPGRSQLLKKTLKNIIEEPSVYENTVIRQIEETENYYIRMGGSYQRVRSKSELLALMHDHQKEIQKYIKKVKLNFRNNREDLLIRTAEYYDQIAK